MRRSYRSRHAGFAAPGFGGTAGVEERLDVPHDATGDLLALRMAGATARVEVQRLAEAHGERTAARNVEAPPRQRFVGAADGCGNHRHARPERHHGDAGLAGDEAALAAERPFREDPDHAALLQYPEAPFHGAWVRPAQADSN